MDVDLDARTDEQSDVTELVRIYGAIDQALVEHPERRAAVAQLMPAYRDPGARWYSDYQAEAYKATEGRADLTRGSLPTLVQGLRGLGDLEPRCRMRARRLYAIAAALRAFPELDADGEVRDLANAALQFDQSRDEGAEPLLDVLAGPPGVEGDQAFDVSAWWQAVQDSGSVANEEGLGPVPCSGRLVPVKVADEDDPATTLRTEFETSLTFEQAAAFCEDPEKWECFPFWCSMDEHPPDNGVRYRETVSFDCHNQDRALTFIVDLDFSKYKVENPRLAVAQYRLSNGQPQSPQRVLVNEGSLVVHQPPGPDARVRVITTKRIRFSGSFDGPAFAQVLCLVGYLGYVEDLVCCAAGGYDPGKDPHSEYPGWIPPAGKKKTTLGADPDFRGMTGFTIKQVAAAIESRLDDCAKKVEKGYCLPNAPFEDLARGYSRLLREGAAAADIGLRSVGLAPGIPGRKRSVTPASGSCTTTGAMACPMGEVVEGYLETMKKLVSRWSDYGVWVATRLDDGTYTADRAVGDLAGAVQLSIESGARLAWEAVDACTILTGRLGPHVVDSDEFTTTLPAAELRLESDLINGFGEILPTGVILIIPVQAGDNETKFKLRAIATGRRAGTYIGHVVASAPEPKQPVWITIP